MFRLHRLLFKGLRIGRTYLMHGVWIVKLSWQLSISCFIVFSFKWSWLFVCANFCLICFRKSPHVQFIESRNLDFIVKFKCMFSLVFKLLFLVFIVCILFVFFQHISIYIVPICLTWLSEIALLIACLLQLVFNSYVSTRMFYLNSQLCDFKQQTNRQTVGVDNPFILCYLANKC